MACSGLGAVRFARLACVATILVVAGALHAAPTFPPLSGRVVDQAALLDRNLAQRLNDKLADLETKTGNQLVVVTLQSLQDYDIADYGYQLGRNWGIGQQGKNNGALLIVAPNERKVRIEVGYGLEGMLTDAVTRLIIDNAILPRFRAGDFAGGIERGVDDVIQVLSGQAEEFKQRAAQQAGRPSGSQGVGSFAVVLFILAIWLIIFLQSPRRQRLGARRAGSWGSPIIVPSGGWSGGGWSGGGGSGDGGGGGFSGGGGSFGGGGSSGSW